MRNYPGSLAQGSSSGRSGDWGSSQRDQDHGVLVWGGIPGVGLKLRHNTPLNWNLTPLQYTCKPIRPQGGSKVGARY